MKVADRTARQARPALGPRRGWSHERLLTAGVLFGWSVLLWWLILLDRVPLYLGSRTSWIVPVGAVVVTVVAIGMIGSARGRRSAPLRSRQVIVAAALTVPVILVTMSPPTTLGSFSVDRKAAFSGRGLTTFWGTFDERSGITLQFAAAAQFWPSARKLLAGRAGEIVTFDGFVSRESDTPPDEFLLTRFVITCCVADATIVQVRVVDVPPGRFETDAWVEVRGAIFPMGAQIIVTADSVEPIATPRSPYLAA